MVTQELLAAFIADQQARYDAYIAKSFPTDEQYPEIHRVEHFATFGKRYARVARKDRSGSCSVVCFIDMNNGDILKGSWKAPVKNGVRGSILSDDRGASVMTWCSVKYLR